MKIGKLSRKQVDVVRQQVFQRDGHRCVVAGTVWETLYSCGGPLTIQHAVARGMGGSAQYDGVDYLRTMCAVHNGLDTANAAFHNACIALGWTVARWLADTKGIKIVPVMYIDGWHLLQDGQRIRISDKTAYMIHADLEMN